MNSTSARFLKYSEIDTDETDIYDDAWGFSSEFSDVIACIGQCKVEVPADITDRLDDIINRIL